jgi:hypothetical protein
MWVAEKLDWKGFKIKKSVGNRKIIMSDEVRHRIGKGYVCHLHVPMVLVCVSLNILKSSAPVQVCNRIALQFYLSACDRTYERSLPCYVDQFCGPFCVVVVPDSEVLVHQLAAKELNSGGLCLSVSLKNRLWSRNCRTATRGCRLPNKRILCNGSDRPIL